MSEVVISAENIGKKYKISHQTKEKYVTLRETIASRIKAATNFSRKSSTNKDTIEDFWALSDLNFEIRQGEAVGVIGRNGAGKSTLLKVISRITEPTVGKLELNGRVASLLEVGTGFHPELTGRENIYLNGAILGMTQVEIKRKFDEIVDFSGVEKFLDTPVKRYSSGMYVRLAFAVAAHLDPEILIIDEVLAVGDAEFQKKCLNKMDEVSKTGGRTILFVSHNMTAIQSLCSSCIWLEKGKIQQLGASAEIIQSYQNQGVKILFESNWEPNRAPGSAIVRLYRTAIVNSQLSAQYTYDVVEKIGVLFEYEVFENDNVIWAGFNLYNSEGINVFDSHSVTLETYSKPHEKGIHQVVAWIPADLLNEGFYSVSVALFNHLVGTIHCYLRDELSFSVVDKGSYGRITAKGDMGSNFPGIVRPLLNWEKTK